MQPDLTKMMSRVAWSLAFPLFALSEVSAQTRLVLPEGSVIVVRTSVPLESNSARSGQRFETVVADTVPVDDYTAIPAGSRIQGVITFAQPADRQRSGVIEVAFDRLTLTDGTTFPIQGRLTSTDAAERRQIESDPNARVVLVGGRGGIGAGIAGAGSSRSPASSILTALGGLLSSAQDVRVPAGTPLAVQLEQRLVLRGRGRVRAPDEFTIYTAADRIRAAQQALAQQNYYRGTINGQLDDATQRALFEFQVDKGIIATGNLDGRTAQALGLATGGVVGGGGVGGAGAGAILSAEQASALRRGAQAMAGRQRQELSVSTVGRLDSRRAYAEGDIDLWFALSAFADNASLYEQIVRMSGNVEGSAVAGRSLLTAARRVDAALQQARPSPAIRNAWATTRRELAAIDPSYAY